MINEKTRVIKNVPSIKAIPIIIKLRNSEIMSGWRAADLSKPFIKNPSARDTPIQARHRPKYVKFMINSPFELKLTYLV